MVGLVIEDIQGSPKFYQLINNNVVLTEYCAHPLEVFKEGAIVYESIPEFNFPWYRWLWWREKKKLGYFSISQTKIAKIRCQGIWWGYYLFEFLKGKVAETSLTIIKENNEMYGVMFVVNGLLKEYFTLPRNLLKEEVIGLINDHRDIEYIPIFQYGISEEEVLTLSTDCRNLNIYGLEECVVKSILVSPSKNYFGHITYTIISLFGVNVLWDYYCYSCLFELDTGYDHGNILSELNLPKKIDWGLILDQLDYEKVIIYNNRFIIKTKNITKTKRVLKKFGFTIIQNESSLVSESKYETIEALW